jgi:hypothetical protein
MVAEIFNSRRSQSLLVLEKSCELRVKAVAGQGREFVECEQGCQFRAPDDTPQGASKDESDSQEYA